MYQVFPLLFLYFSFTFPLPNLRLGEIKKIQTAQRLSGFLLRAKYYFFKNKVGFWVKLA